MKRILMLTLLFLPSVAEVRAADGGGAAPATITREGDLVIVTLTADAEQRLRLKTVPVDKRVVPHVRIFSGEVVLPLGMEGQAVAPVLGGTLEEVLRMADLQTAADGRILQARVEISAAKIALDRAESMVKAEAGSLRAVDEAKAALELAEAALTTAQAQRDLLGAPVGQDGPRRRWVRAAIYSAEAAMLDEQAPARMRKMHAAAGYEAKPVKGPPTANAATTTIDWYYELPLDASLRAGERIVMEIPALDHADEHLVIPFSAVLHDIHGGQWVYERTAEHTFTRRRVQVARVAGADAVLSSGPAAGTLIVTDGSAELFGTEFFTGH
jgi:multidrug efflux system membrane fusion protein